MIATVGELPSGTVTFLLTDVEESTQQWDADAEVMARAMVRHDEVVTAAIAAHNGAHPIEQGEGDSVVAAFARASDALAAAIDAQRALLDIGLKVRMGIHTGEARVRDNRYAGPAIIRAARVRALAHGGQIVVSQGTRDLLVDALPLETALEPAGEHALRGLDRPEAVYVVCHPGLPALAGPAPGAPKHNLPLAVTSLIGRSREIDGVSEALRRSRLVTLTGPGGAGKTRLATELGRHASGVTPTVSGSST
jgi:class 3 adenylate cyclase